MNTIQLWTNPMFWMPIGCFVAGCITGAIIAVLAINRTVGSFIKAVDADVSSNDNRSKK